MTLALEPQFKIDLLQVLNSHNLGWVDGDREPGNQPKADLLNKELRVAIEIKDNKKYKLELPKTEGIIVSSGGSLKGMNETLSNCLVSAFRKFKGYPDFRTILLIRSEFFPAGILARAIMGIYNYQFDSMGRVSSVYRTGKYSPYIRKFIGGFCLAIESKYYYWENYDGDEKRIVSQNDIEKILGTKAINPLIKK